MNRTKMAEKQATLARTAQAQPEHQFTNLYGLMHWDYWLDCAAQKVLARPGSSTAGVDGTTRDAFKGAYAAQMQRLQRTLRDQTYQPEPVRRVSIPKANGKQRPLGIPALRDRIVQEALRAILDPIFESDFLPDSYGFRKGRCTMDAVAVIMPLTNSAMKHFYVIEGDIRSYFDTVHHRKLMTLLRRRIKDRDLLDLIWKFLKAGVMEGQVFARTAAGVPQGGIMSPLLANIYLHELDRWADRRWNLPTKDRQRRRYHGQGNYRMVRYADDFVVVTNAGRAEVEGTKQEIRDFLATELHLDLADEKTVITHVTDGFTFLGFHIQRVYSEGRWVTHLRPPRENKERVKRRIKELTGRNWTWMDEYTRLTSLNTIVRGWCAYYQHTSLVRDLEEISRYTWHRYLLWLRKKHKGSRKQELIRAKTKTIHHRTRWTATLREGNHVLEAYQWLPSPVELKRSRYLQKGRIGFPHPYLKDEPDDEDYPQWEAGPAEHLYTTAVGATQRHRNSRIDLHERMLRVKIRDGFRCQQCGSADDLRVHHTKGQRSHRPSDLVTLCLNCHHKQHGFQRRPDGEPDALKGARPVRREAWGKQS